MPPGKPTVTPPTDKRINRRKTRKTKFTVVVTGAKPNAELIAVRKAGSALAKPPAAPADKWAEKLVPVSGMANTYTADVMIRTGGKEANGKADPGRRDLEVILFAVQNPDDPATGVPDAA